MKKQKFNMTTIHDTTRRECGNVSEISNGISTIRIVPHH